MNGKMSSRDHLGPLPRHKVSTPKALENLICETGITTVSIDALFVKIKSVTKAKRSRMGSGLL